MDGRQNGIAFQTSDSFTPNDSVTITVTLAWGTFHFETATVIGRMGYIVISPVITIKSFGVNKPLGDILYHIHVVICQMC